MKKIIISLLVLLFLNSNAFSAGSSGGDSKPKSNYDEAVKLIKSAKKNEKKKVRKIKLKKNMKKH